MNNLEKEKILNYLLNSINEIDKKIYGLEQKIEKLILENSEIELDDVDHLPLVFKRVSNYGKLKCIKDKINERITIIDKSIKISRNYNMFDENIILQKIGEIEFLYDQLKLIEENPKDYLRHFDAYNFDYSNVKDLTVRKTIKCLLKQLSLYRKMRYDISKEYKKIDLETSNYSLNLNKN